MAWLWMHCLRGVPAYAQVEPPGLPLALEGDADDACITASELHRRVEERIGRTLAERSAQGGPAGVVIRIDRHADGAGFTAEVRSADTRGRPLGRRALTTHTEDCRALDEALVLVVSTLVGIGAAPRETIPKPPAKTQADPPAEPDPAGAKGPLAPAPPPHSSPRREQRPPEPWSSAFAAHTGIATGLTPQAAWTLAVGPRWSRSHYSVGAGLALLPHSRKGLGRGAWTAFSAVLAYGQACGRAARGTRARLDLCAGVQVGGQRSATHGLGTNATTWTAIVDGRVGARLELGRSSRKAVGFLEIAVDLPFLTPRYELEESGGELRRYHQVAPGVWASVGVKLPGSS